MLGIKVNFFPIQMNKILTGINFPIELLKRTTKDKQRNGFYAILKQ